MHKCEAHLFLSYCKAAATNILLLLFIYKEKEEVLFPLSEIRYKAFGNGTWRRHITATLEYQLGNLNKAVVWLGEQRLYKLLSFIVSQGTAVVGGE